jgi:anti-anti-sigma regulatory factor
VSFRITTNDDGNVTTIRVEGRLGIEAVPELRREFQLAGNSVRLDLSGLTSADADGVRELLELSHKGAKLCGLSAYVRQMLDEASG